MKKAPRYDKRNKLNDLTGKDWLLLTKSFWFSEKSADDKDALLHPAPFLIKDIMRLINFFTKKNMKVLDPFCGSGTTLIAAANLKRLGIGIDLSKNYKQLALKRLQKKGYIENADFTYIIGDSLKELKKSPLVDYIVTSPPYHNILRNKGGGLRKESGKGFRSGSRIGLEYYSNKKNDLGNFESYNDFLGALESIMSECFNILLPNKYCSIIISDFTVNKKEVCVQSNVVQLMTKIGYEFVGTIVLLQDAKPLYPFGYPFAYKINHHHQNIINFKKPQLDK